MHQPNLPPSHKAIFSVKLVTSLLDHLKKYLFIFCHRRRLVKQHVMLSFLFIYPSLYIVPNCIFLLLFYPFSINSWPYVKFIRIFHHLQNYRAFPYSYESLQNNLSTIWLPFKRRKLHRILLIILSFAPSSFFFPHEISFYFKEDKLPILTLHPTHQGCLTQSPNLKTS